MTPLAKRQLLQALHPHYRSAPRSEQTKILDAFTQATGYHRKYAISLLRHGPPPPRPRRRAWVRYDVTVVDALRRLWEASGGLCSKRLRPFLGPLLETLERCGELRLPPRVKDALLRMSPATIDRKLAPARRRPKPRGLTTTRPGSLLKPHIPIRTFAQWEEHRPGFTEMDLVAHCGQTPHGEFVHTLTVVDIATTWFEPQAVPNRSQRQVFQALTAIRDRLPFPLLGLDADNDHAFINAHLLAYCRAEHLTFTRAREYRKNDQAHVEERNGAVIRRTIGYDRYEGEPATAALNAVYEVLRLWINFFQPSMRLVAKQRVGARVHKRYDQARTPYQRVLDSPAVSAADKQTLHDLYLTLNPIRIRDELDRRLQRLWTMSVELGSTMRQRGIESKVLR
jgi:hypothetical protein